MHHVETDSTDSAEDPVSLSGMFSSCSMLSGGRIFFKNPIVPGNIYTEAECPLLPFHQEIVELFCSVTLLLQASF